MTTTASIQKQSIDTPDEVREFPHGRIDIVRMGEVEFARTVFEPGWKWSESVKPIAESDSCEFGHGVFIQSGSMEVRMDDGTEMVLTAGDVALIAPGHDAWVVGDEPCVAYDFGGDDADYAKPRD